MVWVAAGWRQAYGVWMAAGWRQAGGRWQFEIPGMGSFGAGRGRVGARSRAWVGAAMGMSLVGRQEASAAATVALPSS